MGLKQNAALPDLGTDIRVDKVDFVQMADLCTNIRYRVFVLEQQVPVEEEWDGLDNECDHYILWADGNAVGTARVRYDEACAYIQRVAVLGDYRGKGFGRALMLHIIQDIDRRKKRGLNEILLSAQVRVQSFYESLGFVAEGDIYLDAGIDHIAMRLHL